MAAAIRVARAARPDDVVVVLNPDSGRGYLSRVFDDDWMANFGFVRECDACVGAVLETRGAMAELLYVNPGQTVREAIEVMKANGISQLPVCKNTPPFANAEVSGSIDELDVMEAISRDPAVIDMPVERVMGPRLPTIGAGQRIEKAVEMLEAAPALLVLVGRPAARRDHPHRHPVVLRSGRRGDGLWVSKPSRAGSDSRRGRSTPGRTRTPPPAPSSRRSRWPRRSPRMPSASIAATSTPARATRRAPPSSSAWRRWKERAHGLAFASGLAAEDTVLRTLSPGGRVLLGNDAYGGTYRLIANVWARAASSPGAPSTSPMSPRWPLPGRTTPPWCGWRRRPTRC